MGEKKVGLEEKKDKGPAGNLGCPNCLSVRTCCLEDKGVLHV